MDNLEQVMEVVQAAATGSWLRVIHFFSSVPDVIWSGVIASLLTLSGVLMSNGSNTKRLKLQLDHDSTEKDKQRRAELRRDVYLTAIQELTKANTYIMSLPEMDFSKHNPAEGLYGFMAAAAKLQLTCDEETVLLVSELSAQYGEVFMKAIVQVQPIMDLKAEVAIRNEQYTRYQSEIARVLAAMNQYNESARHEPPVFDALQESFNFFSEQAAAAAEERGALSAQRNVLHVKFAQELFSDVKRLQATIVPVMVALRRELGLSGDAATFIEQTNCLIKRIEDQLNSTFDDLGVTPNKPSVEGLSASPAVC